MVYIWRERPKIKDTILKNNKFGFLKTKLCNPLFPFHSSVTNKVEPND